MTSSNGTKDVPPLSGTKRESSSLGTLTRATFSVSVTGSRRSTARLSEKQIQAVLEEALGQAGLGVARENYENPMIADVIPCLRNAAQVHSARAAMPSSERSIWGR